MDVNYYVVATDFKVLGIFAEESEVIVTGIVDFWIVRSEERRVGKECYS